MYRQFLKVQYRMVRCYLYVKRYSTKSINQLCAEWIAKYADKTRSAFYKKHKMEVQK